MTRDPQRNGGAGSGNLRRRSVAGPPSAGPRPPETSSGAPGTPGAPPGNAEADRRYLFAALGLIAAFMCVEVVVAVISGSLALLADAGHMLTDVGALAGAAWAASLAMRPASMRFTFGLKRAEILSAAVNGVALLVATAVVVVEAAHRLASPPPVEGVALIGVALAGVAVNGSAAWLLSRARRMTLNVRGALLHVLTDLYAFAGTLTAGAVIVAFGYRRADPIASLLVATLMLRSAWQLLAASGHVLLEGTPESVDLDQVRHHLGRVPGVLAVHDVHAWTLTSDLPVLSAHVVVADRCFADGSAGRVLDQLQDCLSGHFDVAHSTLQLEPASHLAHEQPEHD